MGAFIARDYEQAGSVFVETMHNAGPRFIELRYVLKMMQQRVRECAGAMAIRGMHDHARGFIHHDEILVFINNLQREVLRNQLARWFGRNVDVNRFAGRNDMACFRRLAIDGDRAAFDEQLQLRARKIRHMLGEIFIEPYFALIGRNDEGLQEEGEFVFVPLPLLCHSVRTVPRAEKRAKHEENSLQDDIPRRGIDEKGFCACTKAASSFHAAERSRTSRQLSLSSLGAGLV